MKSIPSRCYIDILLTVCGYSSVIANIGVLLHEGVNNDHHLLNKQPPPTPSLVKTILKAYENDTITLSCNYKYPFDRVRWLKDDREIISFTKPEEIHLENYQLLNNGSLMISNLQPEDTGEYYCEILADNRFEIFQKFLIDVQYSPRILIEPNGIIEAPIGAKVEILCETYGNPKPIINWLHNGKVMANDFYDGHRQNRLIEVKSRNLSGTIECLADNGIQPSAINGITLIVLFPPELHTTQNIMYTRPEQRVQMECFVESAPTAQIYWYHNGEEINSNAHYALEDRECLSNSSNSRYYSNLQHILIIRRVRTSHMGEYKCRAENRLGEQSAFIQLTFRPMPCIFKTNAIMSAPTSHLLIWQTESYSTIIEFQLNFRQVLESEPFIQGTQWTHVTIPAEISIGPIYTASFRLHGLQPSSLYQAVVFARNQYGWSDTSDILHFTTKIEGLKANPFDNSTEMQSLDSMNDVQVGAIAKSNDSTNSADFIDDSSLNTKKVLYSSMYALSHSNHNRIISNRFVLILLIIFNCMQTYLLI